MAELLRLLLDSLSTVTNRSTGSHEVIVVCNVVSVEYTARFMSRDDHRNLFRNAVADHVSYPGSPEIMKKQPFVFPITAAVTLRSRNNLVAFLANKLASSSNKSARMWYMSGRRPI